MQVIGSDPLERQVRQLEPALHVFGHTHIPIDMSVEGEWPKSCSPQIFYSWPLMDPHLCALVPQGLAIFSGR